LRRILRLFSQSFARCKRIRRRYVYRGMFREYPPDHRAKNMDEAISEQTQRSIGHNVHLCMRTSGPTKSAPGSQGILDQLVAFQKRVSMNGNKDGGTINIISRRYETRARNDLDDQQQRREVTYTYCTGWSPRNCNGPDHHGKAERSVLVMLILEQQGLSLVLPRCILGKQEGLYIFNSTSN
jgi:hypothetical protein